MLIPEREKGPDWNHKDGSRRAAVSTVALVCTVSLDTPSGSVAAEEEDPSSSDYPLDGSIATSSRHLLEGAAILVKVVPTAFVCCW